MTECRYHGWCRIEYDNDFGVFCPCIGDGVDTCMMYDPMPDAKALIKLAEELDKEAEHKESSCWDRSVATVGTRYVREISRQIREALGVSK